MFNLIELWVRDTLTGWNVIRPMKEMYDNGAVDSVVSEICDELDFVVSTMVNYTVRGVGARCVICEFDIKDKYQHANTNYNQSPHKVRLYLEEVD